MKGFELVKREDHWALYNEDGHKIAATIDGCNSKLSPKNCEAIANGYDLDELGTEAYKKHNIDNLSLHEEIQRSGAFLVGHKEGFQKALEILGDKKFSELDMRIAYDAGCNNIDADDNIDFQDTINSLQQTEFDVEIVTELAYTVNENSETEMMPEPHIKLDAEGNLILKRI